jgi:1,4-dihydroxy-2-naphthoyl-CoA synthase
MKVNGSAAVYRFVVKPTTANDPRSLGYLADARFWREEQQEGAQAFLEKRPPDFSRFRG